MRTILLLLCLALVSAGCSTCPSPCPADSSPTGNTTLCQFSQKSGTADWEIEDDLVMGGRSRGQLVVNEAGNAVFTGLISLDNDGGFSSIQCDLGLLDVSAYHTICLGLKGDGKPYQLRVDAAPDAPHSYAGDFSTSGNWQVVEIPFSDLRAIRHGDLLDLPPFPGQTLARIQILFGRGTAESFQLEIDRIWLAK